MTHFLELKGSESTIYYDLYDKLSYACILIGSHLWSIVNFLLDCLDCGSHGVWLKFFSNGMLLMFRSARVDPRLVAGRVSVLEPLK